MIKALTWNIWPCTVIYDTQVFNPIDLEIFRQNGCLVLKPICEIEACSGHNRWLTADVPILAVQQAWWPHVFFSRNEVSSGSVTFTPGQTSSLMCLAMIGVLAIRERPRIISFLTASMSYESTVNPDRLLKRMTRTLVNPFNCPWFLLISWTSWIWLPMKENKLW